MEVWKYPVLYLRRTRLPLELKSCLLVSRRRVTNQCGSRFFGIIAAEEIFYLRKAKFGHVCVTYRNAHGSCRELFVSAKLLGKILLLTRL